MPFMPATKKVSELNHKFNHLCKIVEISNLTPGGKQRKNHYSLEVEIHGILKTDFDTTGSVAEECFEGIEAYGTYTVLVTPEEAANYKINDFMVIDMELR